MQGNQVIYGQEQNSQRQNAEQNSFKQDNREKEVMEVSLQAGHLLLENGAEISRVEETIERICRYYGVCSGNAFVLTNGIFVTVGSRNEPDFAKVEHIPVSGTHLDRVAAVNQLSREIEAGMYTVREVAERLECIKSMPGKPKYMQVLASGCGSLLLSVRGQYMGQLCGAYDRYHFVHLRALCQRPPSVENSGKHKRGCPGDDPVQHHVSGRNGTASELHGNRIHYAPYTRSALYQCHTGNRGQ